MKSENSKFHNVQFYEINEPLNLFFCNRGKTAGFLRHKYRISFVFNITCAYGCNP